MQSLVDKVTGVSNQGRCGLGVKNLKTTAQLGWEPHIVLVGEGEVGCGCSCGGLKKVLTHSKPLGVSLNGHWEGGRSAELLKDFMGCIGRSVIPNEKLGREKILRADTGELVSKVSIPVVGRHYDRDASAHSHGTIIREAGVDMASNI